MLVLVNKPPGKLVALRAPISNGALQADALPRRLKLLGWGENTTKKGVVRVGPATVASLAANQEQYGFDKVGIDYEHQSLPGHPNFKESPREYAAYGVPEVIEGDGLYLNNIEWTPSGMTNARNYVDLSPTPGLDENGEVIFLHSVALCPQGAVDGLSFFAADFSSSPQESNMNPELKKLLAALFGLDENASDADFLPAARAYAEKAMKAAKSHEDEKPKAEAMSIEALAAELKALSARQEQAERDRILSDALRTGKLVPAAAKELPIETLRALVSELPEGTVPLMRRTPVGDTSAPQVTALTANEKEILSRLGVTEEDYRKHNS